MAGVVSVPAAAYHRPNPWSCRPPGLRFAEPADRTCHHRSRPSSEAVGAAATRLRLGPRGCRHRELRQRQRVRPPQIAGLVSRTFHRPARPKIGRGIFLCWAGASMSGATTAPTCSNSGSSSVFARPGSDLSSAEPAVFRGCGSGCDSP
ncbi:uncharacterized protein LOC144599419 [Rhinoraja longicauda]